MKVLPAEKKKKEEEKKPGPRWVPIHPPPPADRPFIKAPCRVQIKSIAGKQANRVGLEVAQQQQVGSHIHVLHYHRQIT
jgi:hypothetical protein